MPENYILGHICEVIFVTYALRIVLNCTQPMMLTSRSSSTPNFVLTSSTIALLSA